MLILTSIQAALDLIELYLLRGLDIIKAEVMWFESYHTTSEPVDRAAETPSNQSFLLTKPNADKLYLSGWVTRTGDA